MKAIKNWFLEKEGFAIEAIKDIQKNGFEIVKETEKAIMIRYQLSWSKSSSTMWIPKSCMIDEWETKFSPKAIGSAYHAYLVNIARDAYSKGNLGTQSTFKSGRNVYNRVSFIHQWATKDLIEELNQFGINYMNKAEFAKSLS